MKILGYHYSVEYENGNYEFTHMGGQNSRQQRIVVAQDICDEQKTSTIIHEIIEAINYHLFLELEENKIMSLEAALYQTLTDNGVSLKPLTAELKKGGHIKGMTHG